MYALRLFSVWSNSNNKAKKIEIVMNQIRRKKIYTKRLALSKRTLKEEEEGGKKRSDQR